MKLFQVCCYFCRATTVFAQQNIEELVEEGIGYHDEGNYNKAIETYSQALQLEPKSALVNYKTGFKLFQQRRLQ